MKLLLDENLSRRIIPQLENTYPGSSHVALVGLERQDDRTVWEFAKRNQYVIVSKDNDFTALLAIYGFPPRTIKLALGNCSNDAVVAALTNKSEQITEALSSQDVGLVELF